MKPTNAELEAKITLHCLALQAAVDELNKRAREEYARTHPEIKTVKVNDKLAVTSQYNEWYSAHNQEGSDQYEGRVVTVEKIIKEVAYGETQLFVFTKEFGGLTPMRIAIGMRKAWLEQQRGALGGGGVPVR